MTKTLEVDWIRWNPTWHKLCCGYIFQFHLYIEISANLQPIPLNYLKSFFLLAYFASLRVKTSVGVLRGLDLSIDISLCIANPFNVLKFELPSSEQFCMFFEQMRYHIKKKKDYLKTELKLKVQTGSYWLFTNFALISMAKGIPCWVLLKSVIAKG